MATSVSETNDLVSQKAPSGKDRDDVKGKDVGGGDGSTSAADEETVLTAPEVVGDPPVQNGGGESGSAEGGAFDELENTDGAESTEELTEATPEQLSTPVGEGSAVSDLQEVEGFEFEPEDDDAEGSAEADEDLAEIGTALDGSESGESDGEEAEFGFLASLVPALVSGVGVPLAKAVGRKLKKRTRRRVRRMAKGAVTGRRGGGRRAQILGLIAKLLESAETAPGGESGEEVDELLVETTVGVLESIIGDDDRVRVRHTTRVPWRRVCALRITFNNGRRYRGTGFLIGPRAVATAGHCVHLAKEGGWARSIEVSPGADGTSRPFGTVTSKHFRSVSGWVKQQRAASDIGCVVLPSGAFGGRNLGAFGFAAWPSHRLLAAPAVIGGYPGDKPFAELWGMARRLGSVSAEQLHYTIDTMGGQSGAPVYITRGGERYCVGIHNYGGRRSNTATRITRPVFERMNGWRKL